MAAKIAVVNALKQLLYSKEIEEIVSIVRIDGYFSKGKGNHLVKMLNDSSDLIVNILGKKEGIHARTVFGVNSLLYNTFLEIVVITEIK